MSLGYGGEPVSDAPVVGAEDAVRAEIMQTRADNLRRFLLAHAGWQPPPRRVPRLGTMNGPYGGVSSCCPQTSPPDPLAASALSFVFKFHIGVG